MCRNASRLRDDHHDGKSVLLVVVKEKLGNDGRLAAASLTGNDGHRVRVDGRLTQF